MINLVRNELYKIFHKKGIYIVIIITALVAILTNFLYSYEADYDYIDDSYITELEYFESLDKSDESYMNTKQTLAIYEYADSFGKDSWQRIIIHKDGEYYIRVYELVGDVLYYEENLDNDIEKYSSAKKELENIKNDLLSMTEEEFIDRKIENLKVNLQYETDETYLYDMKAELETLELRKKHNISYVYDTLNDYLESYQFNVSALLSYEDEDIYDQEDLDYYNSLKVEKEIYKGYIENQIDDEKADGQYQILNAFFDEYFIMILVFIILISGSIVSEEFSKGTIKLLLVKPYTRTKILLSKYITTIIMVLFAVIVPLIMQLLIGSIMFGVDGLSTPVIVYDYTKEAYEALNIFRYLFLMILATLPRLILLGTTAFTLSTLFLSTSLANTLTIIGTFGSSLISAYAQIFELDIAKYFITLHWDWSVYLFGAPSPYIGVTFPMSVIICLIYLIVMIALSFIVFKKRNIKNI